MSRYILKLNEIYDHVACDSRLTWSYQTVSTTSSQYNEISGTEY